MFKSYFKTAWRSLNKHKAYSLINIFGLTLGICSCLVIFLVVQYELGYDKFHSKASRIYRVTFNALDYNPSVSMAILPVLRTDFPEVEAASQVWSQETALMNVAGTKFQEKGLMFADEYFTRIFDQRWLEGDPGTALNAPNSVVLTEAVARKFFGNVSALGKVIKIDNRFDCKVTGVIADLPGNTHLPYRILVSFTTVANEIKGLLTQFFAIAGGSFSYILIPEGYDISQMQKRMFGFVAKNWGNDVAKDAKILLQPLGEIHFDQRYLNNTIASTTSRETYYALVAVAMLIIIIACINFINLATAQSLRRSKEVGVRKVLGSTRRQLIAQFLGETTLMVLLAVVIGLIATGVMLPAVAGWLNIRITPTQLLQLPVLVMLSLGSIIIILLAGLYPAFIQSAFAPIEPLKSSKTPGLRGLTLRKSLVVVQFAISQAMIVGTLVVAYQMDFFKNQDLGFEKEAVISFAIPDQKKNEVLRQQLQSLPGVKDISFSSGAPVLNNSFTNFRSPELGITRDDVTELKYVDEAYTDMFSLRILEGRKITREDASASDTVFNVVVNETMIHKLGIMDAAKAIGKHVLFNGEAVATITGVVQDFQSESKHKKIRPCILLYHTDGFYMASVRLQGSNMPKTIAEIDKLCSGLFPDNVFSYEFLDDHIAAWYSQEQKEYTAFKLFAIVAILIGCLGLYGLIAFAAAQRTKEVGVRKVLGASLANIILLFSREFILLIIIAFALSAPLAFYFMHNWLQQFAYQVEIGPDIFVIAILSSFLIAALTISYQAIKAAVAKPVASLRTE